jgi:mRNA-degrading endonuclease toxin of MazEF toxin-antitoxin module
MEDCEIYADRDLDGKHATRYQTLRSQIATLKRGQNIKYAPFVFTEQGAVMLASVLNSPVAIQASIVVVEAFIRLRQMLASHVELARKLEALEKKYDAQCKVVFDAIRELMKPPEPKRQRIGFYAPSKKDPTST